MASRKKISRKRSNIRKIRSKKSKKSKTRNRKIRSKKSIKKRSPTRDTVIHRTRAASEKARKLNKWPSGCFLSRSNEYFVCKGKRATQSCALLRSAKKKALKNGHSQIAKKADFRLKNKICR